MAEQCPTRHRRRFKSFRGQLHFIKQIQAKGANMKKRKIKLQSKKVKTFDEIWKLYQECKNKFGYKNLRYKILENAIELSDKFCQSKKIFLEKLNVRLLRMVLIQMLEQTENNLELKVICLYSKINFPGIYLQAIKKREKLAEKNEKFDEVIQIAIEIKSHPQLLNHILLLAVKLAKNRRQFFDIIGLAEEDSKAKEMAFIKLNRLNY